MRTIKILLWSLCVIASQGLTAQVTGAEILEKIHKTYSAANTLSFNITYTYFDNTKGINPLKTSKGTVKMSGKKYLMSLDGVQMLRNDTFMVIMNPSEKVLMIDSASATPPGNLQVGVPIDSLLRYMGAIKVSEKGDNYLLSIVNTGNTETLIKKTELIVSKTSFFIEKITVFYNTITDDDSKASWNPMMVIDYGGIKMNETIDTNIFSETKFLRKSGNKVLPAVAYKTYELINHLD
jgi:hypothetical protein